MGFMVMIPLDVMTNKIQTEIMIPFLVKALI
jgi:hypothetical protein